MKSDNDIFEAYQNEMNKKVNSLPNCGTKTNPESTEKGLIVDVTELRVIYKISSMYHAIGFSLEGRCLKKEITDIRDKCFIALKDLVMQKGISDNISLELGLSEMSALYYIIEDYQRDEKAISKVLKSTKEELNKIF